MRHAAGSRLGGGRLDAVPVSGYGRRIILVAKDIVEILRALIAQEGRDRLAGIRDAAPVTILLVIIGHLTAADGRTGTELGRVGKQRAAERIVDPRRDLVLLGGLATEHVFPEAIARKIKVLIGREQ